MTDPTAALAEEGGSITIWLDRLQQGHSSAVQPLWDRYFEQLVRLAQARLSSRLKRVADGEDIALSAFNSFVAAAGAGRFPDLGDRGNLWSLLLTLTARKVSALADREQALKRGSGAVHGDSLLMNAAAMPSLEPSPAFAAEVAETCEARLALLDATDPLLRTIAIAKLEGHTNEEVARAIGKSLPTVERKLSLIRSLWEKDAG